MAAGLSAMTGELGLTGIAAAAAGAAAGSVASQLVGMATGNVDKFSWKAVGQSALAAGITAGVGSAITSAVAEGGFMADSAIAPALRAKGATTAIVRAGMGSAVSQAIQGKWSWREVGASTVAGGAGYYAGEAVGRVMQGLDANAVKIAASTGAAVAGSWARSQVMGYSSAETRARLSQAFISGLGQGIGTAISESFASGSRQKPAPTFAQDAAASRSLGFRLPWDLLSIALRPKRDGCGTTRWAPLRIRWQAVWTGLEAASTRSSMVMVERWTRRCLPWARLLCHSVA